jgi:hypothetical protein
VALQVTNNEARLRLDDHGLEIGREARETYSYRNNDYATVRGYVQQVRHFERPGWTVQTITTTILSSSEDRFFIRATLDAYEGDVRVFAKSWDEEIPRDLV